MMQEMYSWYMEHMFHIHEKKRVAYAKRRTKQYSKKGSRTSSLDMARFQSLTDDQIMMDRVMRPLRQSTGGGSKFSRIGAPMIANSFDQFIILNPFSTWKMRAVAIGRQVDELQRLS